jgi:hypothetical protein
MTFDEYLIRVNHAIYDETHGNMDSVDDIPDYDYSAAWMDHASPKLVARNALRDAGMF